MITTVRVAPVEQWCRQPKEAATRRPEILKSQGVFVSINTESMHQDDHGGRYCTGRYWNLTRESAELLASLIGYGQDTYCVTICEHMLEMD